MNEVEFPADWSFLSAFEAGANPDGAVVFPKPGDPDCGDAKAAPNPEAFAGVPCEGDVSGCLLSAWGDGASGVMPPLESARAGGAKPLAFTAGCSSGFLSSAKLLASGDASLLSFSGDWVLGNAVAVAAGVVGLGFAVVSVFVGDAASVASVVLLSGLASAGLLGEVPNAEAKLPPAAGAPNAEVPGALPKAGEGPPNAVVGAASFFGSPWFDFASLLGCAPNALLKAPALAPLLGKAVFGAANADGSTAGVVPASLAGEGVATWAKPLLPGEGNAGGGVFLATSSGFAALSAAGSGLGVADIQFVTCFAFS